MRRASTNSESRRSATPGRGTSVRRWISRGMVLCMVMGLPLTVLARGAGAPGRHPEPDLEFLRAQFTHPSEAPDGNEFLDLVCSGRGASVGSQLGLTHNRTLFIDAHGKAVPAGGRRGYILYPSPSLGGSDLQDPRLHYTIQDVATALGPVRTAKLHNICISSCNLEGSLKAIDFRKAFPNVTNVMHLPAGQLSFSPMLLQMLSLHSEDIHPLHARISPANPVSKRYEIFLAPQSGTFQLGRYVAQLFRPGSRRPYRQVLAGRERLDPEWRAGMGLRRGADAPGVAFTVPQTRP